MISQSHKNKSSRASGGIPDKDTESVFLQSINVIGVTLSNTIEVSTNTDVSLTATPWVYAPGGTGDTIFIDYSLSKPITAVTTFFEDLPAGATFNITDSEYNFNASSLDGSYTFQSLVNNVMVVTGVTLTNFDSDTTKYLPELFDKLPIITLGVPVKTTLPTNHLCIKNYLCYGLNSFSKLGVKVNDVLEYGANKLTVVSISKFSGVERLVVSNEGITFSDLPLTFDDPNTFNHYR